MKKVLSIIIAILLIGSVFAVSSSAAIRIDSRYGKGTPFYLSYPTKEQIIAKAKELEIDLSMKDTYKEPFSLESPDYVPGSLSDASNENALKMLNFIRYIAGVPADVGLKEDYNRYAQAAALVNAANDKMSHYPEQPENMDNALYQLGYTGAGQSNLGWNYDSLVQVVSEGWIDDSEEYNISRVGHRRWVLNPRMKYTGFGGVDYSDEYGVSHQHAMYAFDTSRSGLFAGDYVTWPAPNTPVELFPGSAFSVSLGYEYDNPVLSELEVEVYSEARDQKWVINQSNPEKGFYVNNEGYGLPKCIIFKADDFMQEDTLHVKITGTTKNGVASPIEFTSHLFMISEVSAKSPYIVSAPYHLFTPQMKGSSLIDSAVPGVTWESSDENVVRTYGSQVYAYHPGEAILKAYRYGVQVAEVRMIVSRKDYLLGDADNSGDVSIVDATILQRKLAMAAVYDFCDFAADIDASGKASSIDVILLMRALAKVHQPYAVGKSMRSQ